MRSQIKLRVISIMTLIVLAAGAGHAGVISATSYSRTDVQAAINKAATGDTVLVPRGSVTWSSPVSIPSSKSITLRGMGMWSTIITLDPGGTAVSMNQSSSRVTGFQFANGTVQVSGNGWRVDHCRFFNRNQTRDGVYSIGEPLDDSPTGVVDHCDFVNARVLSDGTASMLTESDTQHSFWAQPLNLGTDNAVYVEDCTFLGTIFFNAMDANYGGRYVFRYNTVTDLYIEAHSVQGNNRAARSWEIYNNTINQINRSVWVPMYIRGGTGVVFNNTITGTWGDPRIAINNIRSSETVSVSGLCDGTSPWDGNQPGQSGYPARDQIGRSTDSWVWTAANPYPPQALDPAYFWNNRRGSAVILPFVAGAGLNQFHIQLNRDYYIDVPKPGYTPYTYPHPLIAEWDARSGVAPAQPASNLRLKPSGP